MNKMRKSKKGVTLVELVLCCAIILLLAGACTAVLASGATVFNQSSKTANAQLEADVLQNFLLGILPSATSVQSLEPNNTMSDLTGKYLFFDKDNDNCFTVRIKGTDTTIPAIKDFEYSVIRAGASDSTDARAQFLYTVTLEDGSSFSSGFIMSNMKFVTELQGQLKNGPIAFNLPVASEET